MILNEIEKGQLASTTVQCFTGLKGDLHNFPRLLKRIIEVRAWERRVDHGQMIELPSLRALITEKPIRGWGQDPKKIEAVIKDDPAVLAMYREEMTGPLKAHKRPTKDESADKACGTRFTEPSVITWSDNAYWQARIQRDAPEEMAALRSGKKTVLDVRKERGWMPKSKRLTTTGDPAVDLKRLVDAWGKEYVAEIARLVRRSR